MIRTTSSIALVLSLLIVNSAYGILQKQKFRIDPSRFFLLTNAKFHNPDNPEKKKVNGIFYYSLVDMHSGKVVAHGKGWSSQSTIIEVPIGTRYSVSLVLAKNLYSSEYDFESYLPNTTSTIDRDLIFGKQMGGTAKDEDRDGLFDNIEQAIGTDPQKADSDGDGINDREDFLAEHRKK